MKNNKYDDWGGLVKDLTLYQGDCIEILKGLDSEIYDSIVTDPPYMINLAGKKWDSPFDVSIWSKECYRVIKSGGYMLCFGATRTIHKFAYHLEEAGFVIKDMLSWVYWEGMPHSRDVCIDIDKALGVDSIEVASRQNHGVGGCVANERPQLTGYNKIDHVWVRRKPASDEAKRWEGWGTGLKPCQEPILLLQKPITEDNIAKNILKHGVGAINIQGCRFNFGDPMWLGPQHDHTKAWQINKGIAKQGQFTEDHIKEQMRVDMSVYAPEGGRFPPNVIYCPKPREKERDAGLDHLKPKMSGDPSVDALKRPRANIHMTVKPIDLMRWLIRLVTPPQGIVLDPFLGSGTTAVSSILEGCTPHGCELTEKYIPIIKGRVQWAKDQYKRENAQYKLPF